MQARYYDPVIGRFYSNDPVDSISHLSNAEGVKGFNRYSYAVNNPYKYIDPDGEKVVFMSDSAKQGYNTAKQYLSKNSPTAAALFKNAESSAITIEISLGKKTQMSPAIGFQNAKIQFDPKTGYIFKGGTQSPATGLGHELINVDNQQSGMDTFSRVEGAKTIERENEINSETGEGKRALHNEFNYQIQPVSGPNCRPDGSGGEICG